MNDEFTIIEPFKDRLKKAMDFRGMKAIELAERTGIHKAAISQYLSGRMRPKSDKLYLFAKVLRVQETYLMGLDVPMEKPKADYSLVSADISAELRTDPLFLEAVDSIRQMNIEDRTYIYKTIQMIKKSK